MGEEEVAKLPTGAVLQMGLLTTYRSHGAFWEAGRQAIVLEDAQGHLPRLSPNLQLVDAALVLELHPHPPQSTVITSCMRLLFLA